MAEQEMMLGVPPGAEPVSERSLEPDILAEKKRKEPRKDRARGIVKTKAGSEDVIVMMRPDKIIVRRPGKRHKDEKPLSEIVDFVIGQGDLFRHAAPDDELATVLADLIVAVSLNEGAQFMAHVATAVIERKAPGKLAEARS
jgi:hypothetical protein